MQRKKGLWFAALVSLAACVAGPAPIDTASPAAASSRETSTISAGACAPTVPRSTAPPALEATGGSTYYGNDALWVELYPDGIIDVTPQQVTSDGLLGVKFPWWRLVTGNLEITALRLDGPSEHVKVDIPSGYGAIGFQSTGVYFPSAGCWQVTGHLGEAELTFVAQVRLTASVGPIAT